MYHATVRQDSAKYTLKIPLKSNILPGATNKAEISGAEMSKVLSCQFDWHKPSLHRCTLDGLEPREFLATPYFAAKGIHSYG